MVERCEEASVRHRRAARVTGLRALANGGSLSSSLAVQGPAGAPVELRSQETVVMGPIRKGCEHHDARRPKQPTRRESQAKAARAQAEAAQAQAERAEAKAKVAKEQDAAIARALQEDDEARRQADLREVAEKEAEAVPDWPPDP